jgi:hypothetical protein
MIPRLPSRFSGLDFMRLDVADAVDPSQWNETVRSLGGSIYHSADWAAYTLAANPSAIARFLTLRADDGRPIGAALAFRVRSSQRLLAALTGRSWLDAIPAVNGGDEELIGEFIDRLVADSRAAGDVELEVGSFASFAGRETLAAREFELNHRFEFELNLEESEESLWDGMEYKRRKNINKAQRSGVVLEDLDPEEGVAALRRLQGASSERIVARGGPDITYKSKQPADPLLTVLDSGLARIVGARVNGDVVSAGLFTCFNGLVYHTLSGHGEAALRTQAPTLLLWETIKRYKAEGARRFNFGGCPVSAADEEDPSHGVYVYKMGFGGVRRECATGRKVLRQAAEQAVRGLRRLLRKQ